jgi:hypothetical protein
MVSISNLTNHPSGMKPSTDKMNSSTKDLVGRLELRIVASKGSTAARLWSAVWTECPSTCRFAANAVGLEKGMGGAGWRHLWCLIDGIDHALAGNSAGSFSGLDSENFPIAEMPSENDRAALMELGDALWHLIQKFRETSKRTRRTTSFLLDTCSLCWRYGSRSRSGEYYCDLHEPRANNVAYKEARNIMDHLGVDGANAFSQKYYEIRIQNPTCVSFEDVCYKQLAAVLSGQNEISSVQKISLRLEHCWPILPNLAIYCKQAGYVLDDAEPLLASLDPICMSHPAIHSRLHRLLLTDQRLLMSMLLFAEAWWSTAHLKRSNWGGRRSRVRRRSAWRYAAASSAVPCRLPESH